MRSSLYLRKGVTIVGTWVAVGENVRYEHKHREGRRKVGENMHNGLIVKSEHFGRKIGDGCISSFAKGKQAPHTMLNCGMRVSWRIWQ